MAILWHIYGPYEIKGFTLWGWIIWCFPMPLVPMKAPSVWASGTGNDIIGKLWMMLSSHHRMEVKASWDGRIIIITFEFAGVNEFVRDSIIQIGAACLMGCTTKLWQVDRSDTSHKHVSWRSLSFPTQTFGTGESFKTQAVSAVSHNAHPTGQVMGCW